MKQIFFFLLFLSLIFNVSYAQELQPGDGVRLTFYNIEDEISGDFFIQRNGAVQLPYVGLVKTTARDYSEIRTEVIAKYDSLYRGVELIIQPLFRISVLGEVRTPGVYYVTGVEKLLDVIALAGGETADSDMSEVYVERKDKKYVFNVEELIEEGGTSEDFYLKTGDRVFVSRKWGAGSNAAILISAAGLIIAVVALFFR